MAQQTICPACGAPVTYNGTADEIRCPFCDTELQVIHEEGQEHFRILSQPGPQKEVLSRPVSGGQPPASNKTSTDASSAEFASAPPVDQPTDVRKSPATGQASSAAQPIAPEQTPDADQPTMLHQSAMAEQPQTFNRPEAVESQPPSSDEAPTGEMPAVLPGAEENDFNTRATVFTQHAIHPIDAQQPPAPQPPAAPRREDEKQTAPGYPGFLSNEADRQAFSPDRLNTPHSAETVSVPDTPAYYQIHNNADVPVTGTTAQPGRRTNWTSIILALIIGLIIFLACAAGAWMMLSRIVRAS